MKILVDIGHPGHYHMFKNIMKRAIKEGHQVVVLLRDKDNAGLLLSDIPVKTYSIGGHKKDLAGKILFAFFTIRQVIKIIKKERPDVAIGESCFYFTPCTWLFRIPSVMVAMNDHTFIENALFAPFSTKILTSHSFNRNFGKKHIRFTGYLQWLYLMDFKPEDARPLLGLPPNQKYMMLRLVKWGAHHDIGRNGLDESQIHKAIEAAGKNYRVFISAEGKLPEKLKRYRLPTEPKQFQSVLYHSSMCISEGATVAAEAAIMGVPTTYANCLSPRYITGLAKDNLLYHLADTKDTLTLLSYIDKMRTGENRMASEKVRAGFDNALELFWGTIAEEVKTNETV